MRWEGSDLTQLPQVLEQQIQSGHYHTAAVGACDSGAARTGLHDVSRCRDALLRMLVALGWVIFDAAEPGLL